MSASVPNTREAKRSGAARQALPPPSATAAARPTPRRTRAPVESNASTSSSLTPPFTAPSPRGPLAAGLDDSRLTCLVGYAASRAAIELKKTFLRHLGPFDVKASEFSILMLLAANADVNQKQLGAALDISPPNMAVTLDRMASRGWVERVRSTRDRRAQQVHLTPAGRDLVRKTEKISRSMEATTLRALSEAERALLIELLLKVATGAKAPARTG